MVNTLRVYCPAGWSFTGVNVFRAYLGKLNVSAGFAELVSAAHPDSSPVIGFRQGECFFAAAESFTLDDLVDAALDVFALEVHAHDREEYPT